MARKGISFILLISVFVCGCGISSGKKKFRKEYYGLFDTYIELSAYTGTQEEFDKYAEIVYNRLRELNNKFDIYNEYDGINNIHTINESAGVSPVKVDADIIGLLEFSKSSFDETGGIVNIAMGPVLSIWHEYREQGRAAPESAELPPIDLLSAANDNTDIKNLIIDNDNNTVYLKNKGMSLDVGAVAKGYASELALEAAREAGLESAVLNAGGNITTLGKPLDGREKWEIGVLDPLSGGILDTVMITDSAVVTSGAYQRYYTVNGIGYNHIIDPNTLFPADKYASVTVLHENSGIADMLSTASFVLPIAEAKQLLKKYGAEAQWIMEDGTRQTTDGYKR